MIPKTLLITLFLFLRLAASASVIYAPTQDADIQARNDNNPPLKVNGETSDTLIAGCAGAVGQDRCVVIPIQLPNFGASAAPFTNASFIVNYEAKNNTVIGSVDIYGLGRRPAPQVLTNDYWTAADTTDPTDAALIEQDVITENSTLYGLKTVSNSNLVNYLNAQYAGGAGAGEYVFFRLSTDTPQIGGASRYLITSADAGTAETAPRLVYDEAVSPQPAIERPFIWVRDSEKTDILSKISSNVWAQTVYNGIVSRVAGDLSDHQSDRDSLLRELPVLWSSTPPIFKTYPTYSEVRNGPPLFDTGVDCAVLYYLTGDESYARLAGDILHNAIKTMLPVTPSTSVGNGGWINQSDLLYEARVMGTQLPIIYDFIHTFLQTNQVYDVDTAGLVDFSFTDAQDAFRTYYNLTKDHGSKGNNWSALMATCMLNSLLAFDDETERNAALQVYLVTGSSRQASLDYDYGYYTEPGDISPESLQYAAAVGNIRTSHMVLLERVDPTLTLFEDYPNLPLTLSRIRDFQYPNQTEQISFGDGHRYKNGEPFFQYEMVYQHAKNYGYTDLAKEMGELINGGILENKYDRSNLRSYSNLGQHNEPLQLLWQAETVTETAVPLELPRTDRLPFAGIALQRNESPNGNSDYGLMGFIGGSAHVHSHACGMNMELYGMGQVMGAKGGRTSYTDPITTDYYRLFAANNTIIVNGASIGDGGWKDIAINTVQTVSMEPQPFAAAVSSNLSFTCSSFDDNKGTLAEAVQQRTLAIVRTSDTSGFYVDLFRSKSTVTNRTAATLSGDVTDQYHDYIYRNIGDLTMTIETNGAALPLMNQANRFQNDVGATYDQPGWRYFSNTKVSYPHQADLFAQFKATPSGQSSIYMDMHMPSIGTREVAKTDSPAIVEAPDPYDDRDSPTLVIRKIGDAWDEPFVSVFEPHFDALGGTVQKTTALWSSGTVVGVKVESLLAGSPVTHYVFSNPNDNQTYTDSSIGLSFQGRFGIIAEYGRGDYELYIGDGRSMAFKGYSISSVNGDTEASMVIKPWQPPVVTANDPVTTTEEPTEPPLLYELIAGWDTWNSAAAPAASVTAPNITGAAATTTEGLAWKVNDGRGASSDGDWGTFTGPPTASTVAGDGISSENLELSNATSGGTITFTVENNGSVDIELGGFHFDAYAFRPKAARTYELSVLPGSGISTGIVFTSAADAITSVGGAWDNGAHDDIDISLIGIPDHTLAAGESVQFLLAFSGGAGDGAGGHDLWVDNVGISGAFITVPPADIPLLEYSMTASNMSFTWTGSGFKVQACTNLTDGVWDDIPGGTNPPVIVLPTDPAAFFRLIDQ